MTSKFVAEVDDVTLMRLKQGDRAVQQQFFKDFSKPVFFTCLQVCGNHANAEDALHEVFIKIFTSIQQFRNDVPIGAWIRRIAVNHCLNLLQSANVKYASNDDTEVLQLVHANDEIKQMLAKNDLEKCLNKLPQLSRNILWLFQIEGLSHQEIATLYNKSVSFSKQTVHRAMNFLMDNFNTDPNQSQETQKLADLSANHSQPTDNSASK